MSLIILTPEQRRLMEQAGDQPVRIEDPEMEQAYILIRTYEPSGANAAGLVASARCHD